MLGDERPAGGEGSGGGRIELCLSIAFLVHAVAIELAVLRNPDGSRRPAVVKVEPTVDIDVAPVVAVKRPAERPVERPVVETVRAPSPRRASAAAVVDPNDPYAGGDRAGPAAAEAAKVLTVEEPADQPAVASGNAVGPSYGFVAGAATGTVPTFDRPGGGGGTGPPGSGGAPRAAAAEPPPPVNHSRRAKLLGGFTDECPFPGEADSNNIDHALVLVAVTVRPDGTAQGAHAVSDPGHGFAGEAVRCAQVQRFVPALDAAGRPTWEPELTIRIRFTR